MNYAFAHDNTTNGDSEFWLDQGTLLEVLPSDTFETLLMEYKKQGYPGADEVKGFWVINEEILSQAQNLYDNQDTDYGDSDSKRYEANSLVKEFLKGHIIKEFKHE
jgi:hypothetical protein